MPSVHKLFSSRIKTDVYNFVGESGRIFYNEESGELRISDGQTPYGSPIYSSNHGSSSIVLDRYMERGVPIVSPEVDIRGIAIGDGSKCRQSNGFVQSSGVFVQSGDAQVGSYVVRGQYSSGVWEPLYLDGISNRLVVQSNQSISYIITIIGRRINSSSNEGGVYQISGGVDRLSSLSSIRLIGVPSRQVFSEDNPIWDVRVVVNQVHGSLDIEVRGEYSKVIRWVGHVHTVEVSS